MDSFDYAVPYDIMCGFWTGMSNVYDAEGRYMDSVPSQVAIYWKKRGSLLHYRQDEEGEFSYAVASHEHGRAIGQIIRHSFDLKIDGKACESSKTSHEKMSVAGAETRPGIYLFHLTFDVGHYYNNQFFVSPNERQIIGPFISTNVAAGRKGGRAEGTAVGAIGAIVEQTFTRVSYDVPRSLKRDDP